MLSHRRSLRRCQQTGSTMQLHEPSLISVLNKKGNEKAKRRKGEEEKKHSIHARIDLIGCCLFVWFFFRCECKRGGRKKVGTNMSLGGLRKCQEWKWWICWGVLVHRCHHIRCHTQIPISITSTHSHIHILRSTSGFTYHHIHIHMSTPSHPHHHVHSFKRSFTHPHSHISHASICTHHTFKHTSHPRPHSHCRTF